MDYKTEWECPYCYAENYDDIRDNISLKCDYCDSASEWVNVVHEYHYEFILQLREDIADHQAEIIRGLW